MCCRDRGTDIRLLRWLKPELDISERTLALLIRLICLLTLGGWMSIPSPPATATASAAAAASSASA